MRPSVGEDKKSSELVFAAPTACDEHKCEDTQEERAKDERSAARAASGTENPHQHRAMLIERLSALHEKKCSKPTEEENSPKLYVSESSALVYVDAQTGFPFEKFQDRALERLLTSDSSDEEESERAATGFHGRSKSVTSRGRDEASARSASALWGSGASGDVFDATVFEGGRVEGSVVASLATAAERLSSSPTPPIAAAAADERSTAGTRATTTPGQPPPAAMRGSKTTGKRSASGLLDRSAWEECDGHEVVPGAWGWYV